MVLQQVLNLCLPYQRWRAMRGATQPSGHCECRPQLPRPVHPGTCRMARPRIQMVLGPPAAITAGLCSLTLIGDGLALAWLVPSQYLCVTQNTNTRQHLGANGGSANTRFWHKKEGTAWLPLTSKTPGSSWRSVDSPTGPETAGRRRRQWGVHRLMTRHHPLLDPHSR